MRPRPPRAARRGRFLNGPRTTRADVTCGRAENEFVPHTVLDEAHIRFARARSTSRSKDDAHIAHKRLFDAQRVVVIDLVDRAARRV